MDSTQALADLQRLLESPLPVRRIRAELLGPAIDLLTASPDELVHQLRRAQADRDRLLAETVRLERQLTLALIAIHSAQEEGRAPTWPPVCG